MNWRERAKLWLQSRSLLGLKKTAISSEGLENYQGLTSIDTTFVILPNEKDLKKQIRKKIDEYEKEIQPEKYESLLFYGNTLLGYANRNADLLVSLFNIVREKVVEWQVRNLSMEEMLQQRIEVLVNFEELSLCQSGLRRLKREATLRALAIERLQRKQEKKKYSFFGTFRLAEQMKEKMNRESLTEAKERLLIAIKTIDQQIGATEKMIEGEIDLEYSLRIYQQVAKELEKEVYCKASFSAWEKKQEELQQKAQELNIECLIPEITEQEMTLEEEQSLANEFALLQRKIDEQAIGLRKEIPGLLNQMQEIGNAKKTAENIYELMMQLETYRDACLKWQNLDRFGGSLKEKSEDVYYQAFYELVFFVRAYAYKSLTRYPFFDHYFEGSKEKYSKDKIEYYKEACFEAIYKMANILNTINSYPDRALKLKENEKNMISHYQKFLKHKLHQIEQKQNITFSKKEIALIEQAFYRQINSDLDIKPFKLDEDVFRGNVETDINIFRFLYELGEKNLMEVRLFELQTLRIPEEVTEPENLVGLLRKKGFDFQLSDKELLKVNSFSYQELLSLKDLEEIFYFLGIKSPIRYNGADRILEWAYKTYQNKNTVEKPQVLKNEEYHFNEKKIRIPRGICSIKPRTIISLSNKKITLSRIYPEIFYSENVEDIYFHSEMNISRSYEVLKDEINNFQEDSRGDFAREILPYLQRMHLTEERQTRLKIESFKRLNAMEIKETVFVRENSGKRVSIDWDVE